MTQSAKAFIFDLNGTIIKDMEYHEKAWAEILNDKLKAGLSKEEIKKEMYGKNEELLLRVFGEAHFSEEEMHKLSVEKEEIYRRIYLPHLSEIKGFETFIKKAAQHNILIALGTAAVRGNVDFIFDNLQFNDYFKATISADDVDKSKPDPETFMKAADFLNMPYSDCIVFEDSPKGVETASNAEMKCVVITDDKSKFEKYANILFYIKDYTDPVLDNLFNK